MKVALNLGSLDDTETVTLGRTIITGLTGNATFTPQPSVAALTTITGAAGGKLDAVAAAKQALALAVTQKDDALDALRAALTEEAATVEKAVAALPANQQKAAIESAGMEAQSAPTRLTSLGGVEHLSLTAGDAPGELDWHCDPVDRMSFLIVEWTTDPVSPTAHWQQARPSTKSSGTLTNLTSGAAVSIRLRAEGTHGIAGAPAIAGPKTVP